MSLRLINAHLSTPRAGAVPIAARLCAAVLALGLLAACTSREEHPKRMELNGVSNFRDLGGLATPDGRRVKQGVLFRSDHLDDLDGADFEFLQELGVKRVYDLRDAHEKDGAPRFTLRTPSKRVPVPHRAAMMQETAEIEPNSLPSHYAIRVVHLPIYYPGLDRRESRRRVVEADIGPGGFERTMIEANRAFALDYREEWAELLRALADADSLPAVVHCVEGKDRTGFAIAVVLSALGVPREAIYEDYVLSRELLDYRIRRYAFLASFGSMFRLSKDEVRPLLEVRRKYLEAAFEAIDQRYGSFDIYLRSGLGLDEPTLARLRENLTE